MITKVRFRKSYIVFGLMILWIIVCQSCMTMRMNSKETKVFFEMAKIDFVDKTTSFDGFKIHYLQTGNNQNPTLIFVHGSPGSWDVYKRYLKDSLLLKKYRMIAIDRPGFGYSNFRTAEDLKTQGDRITIFIKSIDNKKPIVLVGHSMGGPVVAKLATLKPEWYQHLVILAGAIDPNAETPEVWRKYLMKKPLRFLIPGALLPANDELWWLKKDLVYMKPNLKKITSSITVIHGTKDPLVPYSNMAFIRKEFVNAKAIDTISIKNANHFIPWEHYDLIRDVLLQLKV